MVVRDKAYVPSFLAPPVPGCAAGTLNTDCDSTWPRYSQGTTRGHPAAGQAAGSVLLSLLPSAAWGETGPQGGVPGTAARQAWPTSLERSAPALSGTARAAWARADPRQQRSEPPRIKAFLGSRNQSSCPPEPTQCPGLPWGRSGRERGSRGAFGLAALAAGPDTTTPAACSPQAARHRKAQWALS